MTKPKKIMIGIPFNGGMSARFHLSVTNLAHRLISTGCAVDINYEEGSLLSTQRNKITAAAKADGCDLLFIDSDMVFAVDDALRLLTAGKDIIGGLYYGRRPPFMPLVFGEDLTADKYVFRSIKDSDIPAEPFLCKGLGAGFLFISHAALEKIWAVENDRPFNFMALANGDQYGEDLSFFRRCNLLGLDVWCDPRGDIGHESQRVIYRHDHRMYLQHDHHYCNDIAGWMTAKEQNWLYDTAKKMKSIAEIGCWKGKGTHALASGCGGTVTAIDHFRGSQGERDDYHREAKNPGAVFKIFMDNVGDRFKNVTVEIADGVDAARAAQEAGREFDMVFVDAGHTYQEVWDDLKAWDPLAGKLIGGHDYTNMAGVQRAVNEFYEAAGIKICESIWYVEK